MNRRNFIIASAALTAGCASTCDCKRGACGSSASILFGACRPAKDAKLMKSVGYDFFEWGVAAAMDPTKDEEWWKQQKDMLLGCGLPLRSCNGFLPGTFRLTGPKADHAPALAYAEKAVRRGAELGVKTIVFGSGGARNVPGDFTAKEAKDRPDLEKGTAQYTDFCRELCRRTEDLGNRITVVIEPLRPNESNILNFVWQGAQVCRDVNSPRLNQLADIFHMMMGRETADSIRDAGALMKHCHIAAYGTRQFPGSDPDTVERFVPYFEALKDIGYQGGVSCECGWGEGKDFAKNLETALKTMKNLAI